MEHAFRKVNGSKPPSLEAEVGARLSALDWRNVQLDYWRRNELAVVDGCIAGPVLDKLRTEIGALQPQIKRRRVWGYKASGSVACHAIAACAPTAIALYQSPALLDFLSSLAEQPLQPCPLRDPHAAAVYWYDRAGDHVGFHYDVSHYVGARYTVLLGIEDNSSGRLQCRLHARDRRRAPQCLEVRTAPGKLVFFNGNKVLHAVSPIASGERRIVLSMQYVTDARMRPWRRVISTLKDSFVYFGTDALAPLRTVFS
jgi:hypothetical protein